MKIFTKRFSARLKRVRVVALTFILLIQYSFPILMLEPSKANAAPPDPIFVGSPRYVRELNAGDLSAQINLADVVYDMQFSLNGVDYLPGTLNTPTRWRLYYANPAGEYNVTARYQLEADGEWFDVPGSSTLYSLDIPWFNYVTPATDGLFFRPTDNFVRVRIDDQYNQFKDVSFRIFNALDDTEVATYNLLRDQCDLAQAGNYMICDLMRDSDVVIPPLADGLYYVKIQSFDMANGGVRYHHANSQSFDFTIDSERPLVTNFVIEPVQVVYPNLVTVSANATDNNGVENVRFYLTLPRESDGLCTGNGDVLSEQTVSTTDLDGKYRVTLDASGLNGDYCVNAIARDLAASHSNPISRLALSIDTTAPVVSIDSPLDGAVVSGVVDIYGSVVDENPWRYYHVIRNSDGVVVNGPGTVYEDQSFVNQLIHTWNTELFPDGVYLVHIAARDLAGNRDDSAGSMDEIYVTVDNIPDSMTIQGYKYEVGDEVLNDWEVRLYNSSWVQLNSELTGSDGNLPGEYRFDNLLAGTYYVCEANQMGWTQSYPELTSTAGDYGDTVMNFSPNMSEEAYYCWEVVIDQSQAVFEELNFGNSELPGPVLADLNICKIDTHANSLPGWEFTLGRDNSSIASGTFNATNVSGTTIEDLAPGMYEITVEGTYDYKASGIEREADAGYSHRSEITFPDWLSGYHWVMDGNSPRGLSMRINDQCTTTGCWNGSPTSGLINWGPWNSAHSYTTYYEHPGGDMKFSIRDDNYADNSAGNITITVKGGLGETGEISGVTGEDGCYTFEDLIIGEYFVTETEQEGWIFVGRDDERENGDPTIVSPEGSNIVTFYNFELVTILGYKWEDADQSSEWDAGEAGVAGWEMSLYDAYDYYDGEEVDVEGMLLNEDPIQVTVTNVSGEYRFDGLMPQQLDGGYDTGVYIICEDEVEGWTQTFPTTTDQYECSDPIFVSFETTEYPTVLFGNYEEEIVVVEPTEPTEPAPTTPTPPAPQNTPPTTTQTNTQQVLGAQSTQDQGSVLGAEDSFVSDDDPGICGNLQKLSGSVFIDGNGNDKFEKDEEGIEGVEVTVYYFDKDNKRVIFRKLITDKDGKWEVEICPGKYEVEVSTDDLPENLKLEESKVEVNVVQDKDAEVSFAAIEVDENTSFWDSFPWWILILILILVGGAGYYSYRRSRE